MRLATRMTLALGTTALILFSLSGALQLHREEAELQSAFSASMRQLSRTLTTAIENALRDRQFEDVGETLQVLAQADPLVQVYVLDQNGQPLGSTGGSGPSEQSRQLLGRLSSAQTELLEFTPEGDFQRLNLVRRLEAPSKASTPQDPREANTDRGEPTADPSCAAPESDSALRSPRDLRALKATSSRPCATAPCFFRRLTTSGERCLQASVMVLERPLLEMSADLAATRRAILASSAAFMLITAGLIWLLSRLYVGRPLQRLMDDIALAQSGTLRSSLLLQGTDEVGAAHLEFRRLLTQLDEATRRVQEEQLARRQLEEGLQRADKLITLGQLSASLAHEIGSPLQVLLGRARALHKHADQAEQVKRGSLLVVEQAERIARIIEQMLSITRRRPWTKSLLDASLVLGRVVNLLEHEFKQRRLELDFQTPGPCMIEANSDELEQLTLNLLRNAMDAAPAHSRILLSLQRSEESLLLTVQDEGPGLAPEVREHLFEPFTTTKLDQGGTGLGLTVVRTIVLNHQGQIQIGPAASAPDRTDQAPPGCLVQVRLPTPLHLGDKR